MRTGAWSNLGCLRTILLLAAIAPILQSCCAGEHRDVFIQEKEDADADADGRHLKTNIFSKKSCRNVCRDKGWRGTDLRRCKKKCRRRRRQKKQDQQSGRTPDDACYVQKQAWIGDGYCDGGAYNTPECGYDAGDCLVDGYPDCVVNSPYWIGDGTCDDFDSYNTPECGFDGGDCSSFNPYPDCAEDISLIGNGICNGGAYNTPECAYDGFDCLVEGYPDCRVDSPSWLGDGECDDFAPNYNTEACGYDLGDCVPPIFGYGRPVGTVSRNPVDEASGLAVSRKNPGVIWTMNDRSEGGNWIYAINEGGEYLGRFTLEGADNVDYEDMSIREDYIYVADIGDGSLNRGSIVVYRVQEPTISADGGIQDMALTGVQSLTLQYPEGRWYNAETLLVDPLSDYLYIVTKSSFRLNRVFRGEWPSDGMMGNETETVQLTPMGGTMWSQKQATGGAVSWDGREILVKNYEEVLYFTREEGEDIGVVLTQSEGISLPYMREAQGEGISFAPNGTGYYTLSETAGEADSAPLLYYERT